MESLTECRRWLCAATVPGLTPAPAAGPAAAAAAGGGELSRPPTPGALATVEGLADFCGAEVEEARGRRLVLLSYLATVCCTAWNRVSSSASALSSAATCAAASLAAWTSPASSLAVVMTSRTRVWPQRAHASSSVNPCWSRVSKSACACMRSCTISSLPWTLAAMRAVTPSSLMQSGGALARRRKSTHCRLAPTPAAWPNAAAPS
mmetsp:Transcript_11214/g.25467  ORF Transcript_11214/g.25467 Transcript_11214/m.25467 type:complete len:206 (-) Transcript_11214:406-1023(-)